MNSIICGIILENDEYSPIYANVESGDLYYPDSVMGDNRAIEGISASEPIEVDYVDGISLHKAGEFGDCIGFVQDGEDIILIISDSTAQNKTTGQCFDIDIYGDYDDADED